MRFSACTLALLALAASPAAAQVGTVDGGFGPGGVAITPFAGERNQDFADDVVVLPDGRIVAAGTVDWDLGPVSIGLARYLPSGELDPAFGDGGRVVTRREVLTGRALVRQPDGRLVVGGAACEGATCDMSVVRYTADGALDGSFGDGGFVRVGWPACGDEPPRAGVLDLALEPDGDIVAAGSVCETPSKSNVAAVRLTPGGALDPSFGDGGRAVVDVGDFASGATGVAIDAVGRVVLGGGVSLGETPNLAVRLTAAGQPDPLFDGDGVRMLPRVGAGSDTHDVGVLPDRRIVVAGTATHEGVAGAWFVKRLHPDGSDDASYDGDGTTVLYVRTNSAALGVLTGADGTITLAGQRYEEGRGSHIGVARFTPAGALDTSFGGGGITLVPAAQESMGRAIAAGPGGSLAVAGWAGDPEARYAFAVTRLRGSGAGGPTPPPGPGGGPAEPALRIPVRSGTRIRLRRNGTFRLALGPFTAQVSGRIEMLLGPRRFARRAFTAGRGESTSVRLRTSRRIRRLAARRRGVRVVARLTARDTAARYAARRFAFRLVARQR